MSEELKTDKGEKKVSSRSAGFDAGKMPFYPSPVVRSNCGRTALMMAANRGSERFVSLMVEHGADLEIVDNGGQTAVWHAVEEEVSTREI